MHHHGMEGSGANFRRPRVSDALRTVTKRRETDAAALPNGVKRTARRYQTAWKGLRAVTKRAIAARPTVTKRCHTDCRPLPNGELKMSVRYQTVNWAVSVRHQTVSDG